MQPPCNCRRFRGFGKRAPLATAVPPRWQRGQVATQRQLVPFTQLPARPIVEPETRLHPKTRAGSRDSSCAAPVPAQEPASAVRSIAGPFSATNSHQDENLPQKKVRGRQIIVSISQRSLRLSKEMSTGGGTSLLAASMQLPSFSRVWESGTARDSGATSLAKGTSCDATPTRPIHPGPWPGPVQLQHGTAPQVPTTGAIEATRDHRAGSVLGTGTSKTFLF